MYSLIEYSNNYLKTSGNLWQFYRDEPFLDANVTITDFTADNINSAFCEFKTKIAGRTGNYDTKYFKIMVPLKDLINFWRTLETPLINCEIDLIATLSENCFIIYVPVANQVPTFIIIYTKLYCNFINSRQSKTLAKI